MHSHLGSLRMDAMSGVSVETVGRMCLESTGSRTCWRLEHLEHHIDPENPPEGYPGDYLFTGSQRIGGSWRSDAIRRVWKGEFLALLHGGPSEPIVLELNVKA
jgi:hypothetical protein